MFGRGQILRRRPHQKDNHIEIIGNTQEATQILQLSHATQHPQLVVSIDGLTSAYVARVGRAQRRSESAHPGKQCTSQPAWRFTETATTMSVVHVKTTAM